MTDRNERNVELGAFLRSRRAAVRPEDVGLPPHGRRSRTIGLRREDVAEIAGMSMTWYTMLESGRSITVSDHVLAMLTKALRLDASEAALLQALVRRDAASGTVPETVDPVTQRFLDGYTGGPAFVIGSRFDVIAFNGETTTIYGYRYDSDPDERNVLRRLFLDPTRRALHLDWELNARTATALFRANYARRQSDLRFKSLIAELNEKSAEFSRLWSEFAVVPLPERRVRLQHPQRGLLVYDQRWFALPGMEGIHLRIHVPSSTEQQAYA